MVFCRLDNAPTLLFLISSKKWLLENTQKIVLYWKIENSSLHINTKSMRVCNRFWNHSLLVENISFDFVKDWKHTVLIFCFKSIELFSALVFHKCHFYALKIVNKTIFLYSQKYNWRKVCETHKIQSIWNQFFSPFLSLSFNTEKSKLMLINPIHSKIQNC